MPQSSNVVRLPRRPAAKPAIPAPLPKPDDLSFVSRGDRRWGDGAGYHWWAEKAAGKRGLRGNALGEQVAVEYADFLTRSNYSYGSFNLAAIVAAMPPRKEWTGAEQGFLHEIDRLFGVGAYIKAQADGRSA